MAEKWKSFFKAFIPQKISGSIVTAFMCVAANFSFVSKRKSKKHKETNQDSIAKQAERLFLGKYIEKQHDWSDVFFGNGKGNNIARSGCGVIAAYNVRAFLEKWEEPRIYNLIELIGYFEINGAVCGGRFGVAPKEIAKCLKRLGYHVNFYNVKKRTTNELINAIGEEYPALIVTFFNNRNDITQKMHTVCITKENGRFYAHNALSFRNNVPDGTEKFLDAVNASASAPKLICITGISK